MNTNVLSHTSKSMAAIEQKAGQEIYARRKRAIVYCRVSSEKQKLDGESLEYQEEKCRLWAEQNDVQVVLVLLEAKSGYIHYSYREKLTLARQMVRDGLADLIIVYDLRRFSRNFVHSAMIFQEVEEHGGYVVSVSENIDNSLTGRLIRSVLSWCAESEREKINEYANRHWQKRHELGLPMGTTTPPYGWQWGDKAKTFFVLNIEEAAVRFSIFEMFVILEMSIRQIAHKLTLDGIPTPREARRLSEDDRVKEEDINEEGKPKFAPWTTGTVHMYLEGEENIGTLVICKKKRVMGEDGKIKRVDHPHRKVIPGAMPPIVSPEMYARARRKLATNRETMSQRPRDPENYLLVGHIYCALCGNRMKPICEKKTHVYRCNKHMSILDPNPHSEPHMQRIRASFVDAAVWEDCCRLFERIDLIQSRIEEEIAHSIAALLEDTTGKEQIAALKLAIEAAKLEHARQQNDYLRLLIEQDIIAKTEQLARFEEECKSASDIAALNATYRQRVLEFIQFINVMRGKYQQATFQEKRNAIDVLGVRIYVRPAEVEPPVIQVESDAEWLTIADAARLSGIPRTSLQGSINNNLLQAEKYDSYRAIKPDELNRFLRETPIRSRSLFEDVSERIEITYSPLFVGTGVQASL